MIDPKEWKSTLSDAFHPPGFFQSVVKDVVGADISQHRTYEKAISAWRWPLWGVAFEDAMTNKDFGFQRVRVFGDDWHRESAPSYRMVPTSLLKERAVMSDGGAVIEYKNAEGNPEKFVLRVYRIPNATMVNAIANERQKANVERFFNSMSGYITKNNFYKKAKVDPQGRFLDLADIDEADLILPAQQKKDIFFNVKMMVEKWEDYAKFGIPAKRGIILAGPPGTGKSLLGKVLAKNLDCSFLWVTPRHVMEADGFSSIYEFARELAPSIVMLEDADVFGMDRRLNGFNPLLGELLQCLDGVVENKGVVTILTSNYAEVLDSALTNRPGRFDARFLIAPPGPNEAFEILRRTMEKRNVVWGGDPMTLKQVGQMLAEVRASGAYVVEALNYASMLAVERGRGTGTRLKLNPEDLKDAVARVTGGIKQAMDTEKALGEEGLLKWGSWSTGGFRGSKEER